MQYNQSGAAYATASSRGSRNYWPAAPTRTAARRDFGLNNQGPSSLGLIIKALRRLSPLVERMLPLAPLGGGAGDGQSLLDNRLAIVVPGEQRAPARRPPAHRR